MLFIQMKFIDENEITYSCAIDFNNNNIISSTNVTKEKTTTIVKEENMNIIISASKQI